MPVLRLALLTLFTMLAFAANSLLGRVALKTTAIDAASYTTIRLVSGALVLALLARPRAQHAGQGNWWSALALFAYAAAFSFSYFSLSAATGALLLFGAVQATMIGYGIWRGERLHWREIIGLAVALAGLVILLLPGLSSPPLLGSALMMLAGVAWGVYSIRGKGAGDPIKVTAGNFLRAALLASLVSVLMWQAQVLDPVGVMYAVASGAVASGLGYSLWYTVLPFLKATQAAVIQLSVPVIAAVGGMSLLHEPTSLRFVLAATAILGGIAMVMIKPVSKSSSI